MTAHCNNLLEGILNTKFIQNCHMGGNGRYLCISFFIFCPRVCPSILFYDVFITSCYSLPFKKSFLDGSSAHPVLWALRWKVSANKTNCISLLLIEVLNQASNMSGYLYVFWVSVFLYCYDLSIRFWNCFDTCGISCFSFYYDSQLNSVISKTCHRCHDSYPVWSRRYLSFIFSFGLLCFITGFSPILLCLPPIKLTTTI